MNEAELIVRAEGAVGRLTLNRPKVLHALSRDMCASVAQALLDWREDPAIHSVLIDHAGPRGFCAGGDVRAVAESGRRDGKAARDFFLTEYRLNALMFRYPKPVIVVMDGIVMGGGVGITMPARYRLATERTMFGMPEAAIGLFPDVGAGWYLPRLPGSVGMWLALTGARLGPADCLLLGLATDFVRSDRLDNLKASLVADPERFEERLTEIEDDPGEPPVAEVRDRIDRAFSQPSVESIVTALRADGSEWAQVQLAALAGASPTSLKVAFHQLRIGAQLQNFEDEMAMEYRLAWRIACGHDFAEGVRARLIDKDGAPRWSPAGLEEIDAGMLESLFAPLSNAEEWSPLP